MSGMSKRPPIEDDWTAQRRERLEAILAGTTPAQRLAWLEEAIMFAARAGALPRRGEEGRQG
jgi:hypothetical protein